MDAPDLTGSQSRQYAFEQFKLRTLFGTWALGGTCENGCGCPGRSAITCLMKVILAGRVRDGFGRRVRRWRWLVALAAVPIGLGGVGLLTPAAAQSAQSTLFVAQGGSDSNDCSSPAAACATITHALTLASPGATVQVSGAIADHVTVPASLASITISGAQAPPTSPAVVDGASNGTVFTIGSGTTVELDHLTIQHGSGAAGGGIDNAGTVTVNNRVIPRAGAVAPGVGLGITSGADFMFAEGSIGPPTSISGPPPLVGSISEDSHVTGSGRWAWAEAGCRCSGSPPSAATRAPRPGSAQ